MAGLWILLSDQLLTLLVRDIQVLNMLQTLKGWFFVSVTTGILYVLISRYVKALQASEAGYRKTSEELKAHTEELIATEEELRQQFDELLSYQIRMQRQNQYLEALHDISLDMIGNIDLEPLLSKIVDKAKMLGQSQHSYLYLLDKETMEMATRVYAGLPIEPVGFRVKKGEGLVGRVWETAAPVIIHDYNQWNERLIDSWKEIKIVSGFPLIVKQEIVGVFGVSYTEDYDTDEIFMRAMTGLAEMASIALYNAQINNALRESQLQSRLLIEAMPDLVYRIDKDGILRGYEVGRDTRPLYDLKDQIGKSVRDVVPPEIAEPFLHHVRQTLAGDGTVLFILPIHTPSRTLYSEVRMVPLSDTEVMAIVRDITKRREVEDRLTYMGMHDPVTGLYNRAYFNHALREMTEDKEVFPVGIIVCDIDGLKLINDSFGHIQGDQLLTSVAHMIQSCVRQGDIVARIGGDEFAILMPQAKAADLEMAAQCLRGIVTFQAKNNPSLPVSLSLGFVLAESPGQNLEQLVKQADDNMYREKLHRGQSIRSAIVSTLAKAMEARDFITDGHADRLQDIVELVARKAGVPEALLPDCRLLAKFHDIGKVGVPDHILFKEGRLTPEEYEIIKKHCEIGYRIALSSSDLSPIAEWILKHQEWWNGEGYPLGLKGEEIPLVCRILALADAYDAMTNDRPYRKAMKHEEAIAEIERCAGTQFDPELAALFVKLVPPEKAEQTTEAN